MDLVATGTSCIRVQEILFDFVSAESFIRPLVKFQLLHEFCNNVVLDLYFVYVIFVMLSR